MSEEAVEQEGALEDDMNQDDIEDQYDDDNDGEIDGYETEESESESESDDGTTEVELDGKKYSVPKELKDHFLRQSDYTRKTQNVAEQRRELEAIQERLERESSDHQQYVKELSKLSSIDEQIEKFSELNWQELNKQDAVQAQQLWMYYTQLKDEKSNLTVSLNEKRNADNANRQQQYQKHVAEQDAILKRDIKDWSPELANKLGRFAAENFGFTAQELSQVADSRMVKMMHLAYLGDQVMKKQTRKVKPEGKEEIKPVTKVTGSKSSSKRDPSKMTDAEFAKWRRAQIAKR